MDIVVVGMAIALGAVATFLILAVLNVGLSETIVDRIPEDRDDGAIDIRSVNDCGQRFYIPTPGGKFHSCPGQIAYVSITGIDGFPACVQMYGSKNVSYPFATSYDFVLRPNSTGYLTIDYDFRENELPEPNFFKDLYNDGDVHRLSDDGSNWIFVPANQTSVSYYIAPENVTTVNPTTMRVTYNIETKNTKQDEIGNTYLIGIYQICEGQFVTIGEAPYTGRLPLD